MSYRNLLEADSRLQGRNFAATLPTDGQAIVWNNTAGRWEPGSTSGIGSAIAGGTVGSVLFVGTGPVIQQDNANFFWDNTNHRLGINTTSPDSPLTFSSATANKINLLQGGTIGFGVRSGRFEIFSQGGADIFLGQGPGGSMTDLVAISMGNPTINVTGNSTTGRCLFITSKSGSTIELERHLMSTTTTNAVMGMATFGSNNNTLSATAGFGSALDLLLSSSTSADQKAASVQWLWTTATHASRSAAYAIQIVDNAAAAAEMWRIEGNGSGTGAKQTTTGANGAITAIGTLMESITLNTGSTTTDSTIDLPANSLILSVSTRVTTTITTAANFSVGDPTTSNRFTNASTGLTAGSTTVGLRIWDPTVATTTATGPTQAATAKVRITTNVNPGAGVVRITIHYITLGAPTS